jgi:hypothetical protein
MTAKKGSEVVPFPQSRVRPAGALEPTRFLGYGAYVEQLGLPSRQASGHWCSRCRGIWFGYLLEVACPKCGNRHG